jgi:hypothetical protein
MNVFQTLRGGLCAVFLLSLALLAGGAQAASVTYTGTYALSPYLGSGPYSFPAASIPKFDVAGECLSQVCVRLDGNIAGYFAFENYENFPKTVTSVFTAKLQLLRPSLVQLAVTQPQTTTSDPVTAFDGVVDYAGTSGMNHGGLGASGADSVCLTSAADLALFTGAGSISLPCTATNLSTQLGANSWSFAIRADAKVTVTYTYGGCASPVKPTTWGRIRNSYR